MEDSTPIIIGAGQCSEQDTPPAAAHSPMGLAAAASRQALADTGVPDRLLAAIDTLVVVRLFSDSLNRPRLIHGFGRATNPPRAVARRLGANPVNAIYGNLGGNTPQQLVNEMAERIAADEVEVVLLTGAEALRTAQLAMRSGIELNWQEDDPGSLEDRGLGAALTTPHEFEYGIGVPVQTYPLFENAVRARRGRTPAQHLQDMGKLFAPFTQVAAGNPYAFFGEPMSAQELSTVTADNRYIGYPYPKRLNARDSVNQGAAVIMTSVGRARQLGIDPSRWVFLHGCAEASDRLVSERADLTRSPAIRVNGRMALNMAGKTVAELDFFDLYSCFPSAVEIACEELGVAEDDRRGLTVTGGLPFFGGPGNNYSMHAIASMAARLRSVPGTFGMVTANGGWLSKHATGIYSTTPWQGKWQREDPLRYQEEAAGAPPPRFTETPEGGACIETYTVCFDRDGPRLGIVIGRLLETDQRFLAHLPDDPGLLLHLTEQEGVGLLGRVETLEGRNRFYPSG